MRYSDHLRSKIVKAMDNYMRRLRWRISRQWLAMYEHCRNSHVVVLNVTLNYNAITYKTMHER